MLRSSHRAGCRWRAPGQILFDVAEPLDAAEPNFRGAPRPSHRISRCGSSEQTFEPSVTYRFAARSTVQTRAAVARRETTCLVRTSCCRWPPVRGWVVARPNARQSAVLDSKEVHYGT